MLDFLLNREITILRNHELLIIHLSIFSFFQFLPRFESYPEHLMVSLARCFIDSYSKSRSIFSSIHIATAAKKDDFTTKCLISFIYNQLGKYIFERFLSNSHENNSFYKNSAIMLSICLTSSTFFDKNSLSNYKCVLSIFFLLFIGNRMDAWHSPQIKVRSRKAGAN